MSHPGTLEQTVNGKATVLVITADRVRSADLSTCLNTLAYAVSGVVAPGREAVEHADRLRPDVAVIDLATDGGGTVEAGEHLGGQLDMPVVYVMDAAVAPLPDARGRAAAANAYGGVLRPFAAGQLDVTIRTALSTHARVRDERAARLALQQRIERLEENCPDAELEQTVAELRYQSELMDTVFRSMSDGVVVADASGKFLYGNPSAEQIVGVGATEGPQAEWSRTYGIYHADQETLVSVEDQPLVRAIMQGESVDEEDLFVRNPNRPEGLFIRVSARPLLDNAGGIRGGVATFRDVTERVHAEESLAQAFAQGRLEIVDTVLHNVGNAITSVTIGIETVRQRLANDQFGRRLSALADSLNRHRDDLIDYLRDDPRGQQVVPGILALAAACARQKQELARTVERVRDRANRIADIVRTQKVLGTAGMDRKEVDLHEALASAFRVLRDSLAKRGIRTAIDSERAPRKIHIRESQFHQMLVNLIKNSVEAIDELAAQQGAVAAPSVAVKAYTEQTSLIMEVADNGIGIGIRVKDRKVLFAPGYTTKKSGSGLGLHSAANFVIGCGGRIEPRSDGAGTGTTMRITLPLSSVLPPAEHGRTST